MSPLVSILPDATGSTVAGLTPAQMRHAYGLDLVSFSSGKVAANGSGETIAIVDAYNDPNISADLKTFDAKFGLANPTLSVVSQTGSSSLPQSNASWGEEISLDVEWAHAIAPGAKLLLVETATSSTTDLLAGVNYARKVGGVAVVSISWGGGEFNGQTSDDSDFTTPAGHTGVTFVAASGDDGSMLGVDWPASSPEVLSVGGTTLATTGSSGTYSAESGWSDSGGGVSQLEGTPEYQSTVQSDGARTVPDVSLDANPSTGVAVYDSYGVSGWEEVGGTSDAAPQWAGIIAIADQGRSIGKLAALDGATNTLPTLYSLYANSTSYSSDFHDVTSGASSRSIAAGTGYDLVTGIGTPKANGLIPALVSSKISKTLTLTPVVSRGGGGGGGHHWPFFQADSTLIPTTIAEDAGVDVAVLDRASVIPSGFSVDGPANNAVGLFRQADYQNLASAGAAGASVGTSDRAGSGLAMPTASSSSADAPGVVAAPTAAEQVAAFNLTKNAITGEILTSPHFDFSSAAHSVATTLARDPAAWRSATAGGVVAAVIYWLNAGAEREKQSRKRAVVFSEALIKA